MPKQSSGSKTNQKMASLRATRASTEHKIYFRPKSPHYSCGKEDSVIAFSPSCPPSVRRERVKMPEKLFSPPPLAQQQQNPSSPSLIPRSSPCPLFRSAASLPPSARETRNIPPPSYPGKGVKEKGAINNFGPLPSSLPPSQGEAASCTVHTHTPCPRGPSQRYWLFPDIQRYEPEKVEKFPAKFDSKRLSAPTLFCPAEGTETERGK